MSNKGLVLKDLPEIKTVTPELQRAMLTNNIALSELVCKCGCNTYRYNEELVWNLQCLREYATELYKKKSQINQIGIFITSAFRCEEHNLKVRNAIPGGRHPLGLAADIQLKIIYDDKAKPSSLVQKNVTYKLIEEMDVFTGIGFYSNQDFIHVDVRPENEFNRWFVGNIEIISLTNTQTKIEE